MREVCCFIDGSYLDRSLAAACKRADVDIASFSKWITAGRDTLRTYYYTAEAVKGPTFAQYAHREKVRKRAETMDYTTVRLGRVKGVPGKLKEKGVDVYLAVDLVALGYANAYNTALVVGGDEDFVNAIEAVQRLGKHVEVYGFATSTAEKMKRVADRFVQMKAENFGTDVKWLT